MRKAVVRPTGHERTFGEDEIIVSKTDVKGVITYANQTFSRVSGYSEQELLGQPHNLIRHPETPMCVFQLVWDTISQGNEIFGYVSNLCKTGDHYWVFAHVTPTFDAAGNITGYHSSRRKPKRSSLDVIQPLYKQLREIEQAQGDSREGMHAATAALQDQLTQLNLTYDEFIFSLESDTANV
ncbi:MAG: PAS domain-containing protein [Planctomycetales bacterium]|nr:PAS domain-containing protein [Planctomycetales bacterium]